MKNRILIGIIAAVVLLFVIVSLERTPSKQTNKTSQSALQKFLRKAQDKIRSQEQNQVSSREVASADEVSAVDKLKYTPIVLSAQQPPVAVISERVGLPAVNASLVEYNVQLILQKTLRKERFEIEIMQGRKIQIDPQEISFVNEYTHVTGVVNKFSGARVTLTTDGSGVLVGIINDPPRVYEIVHTGHRGSSYIVEVDRSKLPSAHEKERLELPEDVQRELESEKRRPTKQKKGPKKVAATRGFLENSIFAQMANLTNPEAQAEAKVNSAKKLIRIKFIYSNRLLSDRGGLEGVKAMIENQIKIANEVLVNTGVTDALIQSAVYELDAAIVDDLSAEQINDLNRYTSINRNTANAAYKTGKFDFIHVYRSRSGYSSCGIAYNMNGVEFYGQSSWNKPNFKQYAVGVTSADCNVGNTFSHEIGHNLSLDHSYQQMLKSEALPVGIYNIGWSDPVTKVIDIMSYDSDIPGCNSYSSRSTCTQAMRYSIGTSIEGGKYYADAARKLKEIFPVMFGGPVFTNSPASDHNTVTEMDLPSTGSATLSVSLLAGMSSVVVSAQINGQTTSNATVTDRGNKSYNISLRGLKAGDLITVRAEDVNGYMQKVYRIKGGASGGGTTPMTPLQLTSTDSSTFNIKSGDAKTLTVSSNYPGTTTCQWASGGRILGTGMSLNYTYSLAAGMDYSAVSVVASCTNQNSSSAQYSFSAQIISPLVITKQPVGGSLVAGRLDLMVTISGYSPTFQWQKNGVNIVGARSASYLATEAGRYKVTVANAVGTVTSTEIQVSEAVPVDTVKAPVILSQDEYVSIRKGPATVSVNVQSSVPAKFVWFRNGAVVSSLITNQFSVSRSTDIGTYRVVVSNESGSVTSRDIVVDDQGQPIVSVGSLRVARGSNVRHSPTVSSRFPIESVEWIFAGRSISMANVLEINNIQQSNAGEYILRVKNKIDTTEVKFSITVVTETVPVDTEVLRLPASSNLSKVLKIEELRIDKTADVEGAK